MDGKAIAGAALLTGVTLFLRIRAKKINKKIEVLAIQDWEKTVSRLLDSFEQIFVDEIFIDIVEHYDD